MRGGNGSFKKQGFTAAQSALRIAEADFQKAQEAMASFMKQNIGQTKFLRLAGARS